MSENWRDTPGINFTRSSEREPVENVRQWGAWLQKCCVNGRSAAVLNQQSSSRSLISLLWASSSCQTTTREMIGPVAFQLAGKQRGWEVFKMVQQELRLHHIQPDKLLVLLDRKLSVQFVIVIFIMNLWFTFKGLSSTKIPLFLKHWHKNCTSYIHFDCMNPVWLETVQCRTIWRLEQGEDLGELLEVKTSTPAPSSSATNPWRRRFCAVHFNATTIRKCLRPVESEARLKTSQTAE